MVCVTLVISKIQKKVIEDRMKFDVKIHNLH